MDLTKLYGDMDESSMDRILETLAERPAEPDKEPDPDDDDQDTGSSEDSDDDED
jgi:hypothetical protein